MEDPTPTDRRTPVVMVTGWAGPVRDTAASMLAPGTVLVHHDLAAVHEGVVRRFVTTIEDGRPVTRRAVLELAHGCVSCTLREDVLPLLRVLSVRSTVDRIVLHLDRAMEPEALAWAVENVIVAGINGRVDGPAGLDVRIDAVVACLDSGTWLADATGDVPIDEDRDDRTVAQLVAGQVEFADALVVAGDAGAWDRARLAAVLDRLAPTAPVQWVATGEAPSGTAVLERIPASSRRGEISDAFSPLLRGQPPLGVDCGVTLVEFAAERPFHPERLHEAIDVLLEGVVATRGRAWVATQDEQALWLESAGGGLRVARAGRWLAAMTPEEQDDVDTARRAMAALRWDDTYGDRDSSIVVLTHEADPSDIDRALQWALVTDDEFAHPESWASWPDPFGEFHEDPCETDESDTEVSAEREAKE